MRLDRTLIFMRRTHAILSALGEQLRQIIAAALGLVEIRPVRLDISVGTQIIQAIQNSLLQGDPISSIQNTLNSLIQDISNILKIKNMISDQVTSVQNLLVNISEGDLSSIQRILGKLSEKDELISIQRALGSIRDSTAIFKTVTWDIYLDGISIKNNIQGLKVSFNEDEPHNSIELSSTDNELFWKANPADLSGTSRLELHIGSRVLYFLLETRSGDEGTFSLTGRSLSAREDSPFAQDIDFSIEEPTLASEVAEDLIEVCALDWDCDDWVLPKDFEFYGPPLTGIKKIADAIGAKVRSEDDGTIRIRKAFPIRPVSMPSTSPNISYDRDMEIIVLSYNDIIINKYNAVKVDGYAADVELPETEVEESSPVQGDNVHVRLYWLNREPGVPETTWVTDGAITALGTETELIEEEIVTFSAGVAVLNKPLYTFSSITWIGEPGTGFTYTRYSKEVTINNEAYGVAKITYNTIYKRYRCSEHNVEILLALFIFGVEPDVSILVEMGAGDNEAPALTDKLLTSENIAVVRGTAYLDANAYDRKELSITVPYDDDALDGYLAYINDRRVDCTGNFHIKSVTIDIEGPRITNTLGLVQPGELKTIVWPSSSSSESSSSSSSSSESSSSSSSSSESSSSSSSSESSSSSSSSSESSSSSSSSSESSSSSSSSESSSSSSNSSESSSSSSSSSESSSSSSSSSESSSSSSSSSESSSSSSSSESSSSSSSSSESSSSSSESSSSSSSSSESSSSSSESSSSSSS